MTRQELEARRAELTRQEAEIAEKLKPLNEALKATKQAAQLIDNEIAVMICPLKVGDVVTLAFGYKGKTQDWKVVSIHGERWTYLKREIFNWSALSYLLKKDGSLGERSNAISVMDLDTRGARVNGKPWNSPAQKTAV